MKTKLIQLSLSILLLLLSNSLFAQITTNEFAPNFRARQTNLDFTLKSDVSIMTIAPPDMEKIRTEDNSNDIIPSVLRRIAIAIPVQMNVEKDGKWSNYNKDTLCWNLTIKIAYAKSLDLVFDKFWLPAGGKLFLYNQTTGQTIGGITNEFLNGNKENPADFSTGMIIGDELTLEYYQPVSLKDRPIITVSSIYYGYRDIPSYSDFQVNGFGDSGNCQVNVNCNEGQNWQKEKQAIARILVKLSGGSGWCSGSLVNNTRYTFDPLFLTANHCFNGEFDAINNPNLSQWIFYWNYEFPSCDNLLTEPIIRSTTGATIKANNDISDFGLLELTQDPRNLIGFTPYYLGWDRSGNPGTGGVGIHHPGGDVKKIATYNATPINSSCVNNNFWMTGFIETAPYHHSVMEPGSSGSPLINLQRKVIGQLLGPGNSILCPEHLCGNNPELQRVSYGKFSVSWTGNNATDSCRRLRDWLDPNGLNPQALDGNGIPTISGPSSVCTSGTYSIDYLPSGATVQWSIPFSGAPYPRLNPNVPEVNQATITNPNNYPINMTLTANIYMGGILITTLTKLVAVQSNSTTQYGSYYQQGCIVNNVTLRTLSGSINGNYFYLNQGCLAEITLYDMTNKSVSFNSGYPPSYWSYDAANSKLLVRPAVGSSGVPTTFKITGGCTDKTVQFFTYSLNEGRLSAAFELSPNPASSTVNIEIAEETPLDNSAAIISPDMKATSINYTIQLWNSFGLVKQVEANQKNYQLELYGVPPGFYYVHVIKDGQTYRSQLVVK